MIRAGFSIKNLFKHQKTSKVTNYFYKTKRISKNKTFEIQIAKIEKYYLFKLDIDLELSGHDHAGPKFELELFGFMIDICLFDIRHWDYENNTWEQYQPK